MASYDEEEFKQALQRLLAQRVDLTDRAGCPGEESLAGYLTVGLPEADRSKLEEHLSRCSFCLAEIAAVNGAMQETNQERMPGWLMERVVRLVTPGTQESVVQLVVRLARDAVELASSAGEWVNPPTPQLVPVRGTITGAAGVLQVEREIGGYKVAVKVEQVAIGTCQVVITLTSADGKPADGVRLSLMAGGREQASFLTRQGQAVFIGVSKGEYNLVISQAATTVGTINLQIEAEL
jgi:hypothetical protein